MEDIHPTEEKNINPVSRSAIWPTTFIVVGIVLLLKNLDLVSQAMIANTIKLWPLILVYFGIDHWTRSNPRIRTIVTILFISGAVFTVLMLSN